MRDYDKNIKIMYWPKLNNYCKWGFFFLRFLLSSKKKRPKWSIFWFLLQKKHLRTLKLLSYERTTCEQYDIHLSCIGHGFRSHQSFSGQWVRSSVAGGRGAAVSLQAEGAWGGGGQGRGRGRGMPSGSADWLWSLVQKVRRAALPICSKACWERLQPQHIVTKTMSRDKQNNLTGNNIVER